MRSGAGRAGWPRRLRSSSARCSDAEPTVIGNRTRIKVVKNKMAPPFREVEFDILYGQGVSRSGEIIDLATDAGLIQKSGAWYSMGSERIGQGRDNARNYLEQKPQLMEELAMKILEKQGIQQRPSGSAGRSETGKPDASATGKEDAGAGKAGTKAGPNGASRRGVRPN